MTGKILVTGGAGFIGMRAPDGRVKAELHFAGKTRVGETVREVKITLTRGNETILGLTFKRVKGNSVKLITSD